MKVKICGIKDAETAIFAAEKGADFIGLVFFEKSPRNISIQQAVIIKESLKNYNSKIVAVTVDASDEFLQNIKILNPDFIQLHGKETPERVSEISKKFGYKIIKAISISSAEDLKIADNYSKISDYILLDAKAPKGSDLPGGNAISFDWKILKNFTPNYKYFLSGGLNCENVSLAKSVAKPFALDVSSGVEKSFGEKDLTKIEKFLSLAK